MAILAASDGGVTTQGPPGADGSPRPQIEIDSRTVVRHVRNADRLPRVTVGVPTYNRPDMIGRALASLARQTFRDFTVIVSDNAGVNQSTIDAVHAVEAQLPEITLIGQPVNRGMVANLEFLLGIAATDYFMWLADDDEITPDYLAELVALLDSNPNHVAAMGAWHKMSSETEVENCAQLHSSSPNRLFRATQYVAFVKDDTLLYGLHRTKNLRRCRFEPFGFPNRGVITNYGYTFLFDLILQGPIAYSGKAALISHIYTVKQYSIARSMGVKDRLRTMVRRMNVYYLYCAKAARMNPLILATILPAALFGFLRDLMSAAFRIAIRGMRRREAV